MKLVSVKINGQDVGENNYQLTEKKLSLSNLPEGDFELEIETEIKPQVRFISAYKALS